MDNSFQEIHVRGETLHLLPEGALFWPAERTLIIADFHLGKVNTFGQHGLILPAGAQLDDLVRLETLLRRQKVDRLIFLGDLVHARSGLTPALEESLANVVCAVKREVILVTGNHDRALVKKWPTAWASIQVVSEWSHGPFGFQHEYLSGSTSTALPQSSISSSADSFIWAGHVHPCVRLQAGPDRVRLKTFLVRNEYGLLPAFSSLAGGFDIRPDAQTQLYPLGEGEVFKLMPGANF
jgi:DNA ligase-associated metallophosphoesterase